MNFRFILGEPVLMCNIGSVIYEISSFERYVCTMEWERRRVRKWYQSNRRDKLLFWIKSITRGAYFHFNLRFFYPYRATKHQQIVLSVKKDYPNLLRLSQMVWRCWKQFYAPLVMVSNTPINLPKIVLANLTVTWDGRMISLSILPPRRQYLHSKVLN